MEVRSLKWLLEFKDAASDKINKVNESINKSSKDLLKMGDSMSKVGKDLTTKVTAPIMAVGAKALHSVSNFDDGMSRVRSLTGATGKDFDKLREKAIQLGNDTAYSAQDASEMMQVLAASGMETNDILETSGNIFSLMSAGSTDAETAASVLTNTMAQFNLEASDSTRIVDGFAKGSAAAKLGVEDLEYILGQAGGSLASMNMDMEQSVAAAGHLANAGMPIGQVGSALNAMSREVKSNAAEFKDLGIDVYDAEGNLKDLGSVMYELEGVVGDMTDAQRDNALSSVFSGQAMKAATDWIGLGSDAYSELTDEIYNASGASEEMARINEDNIGGALRSLSSSMGTLMINIGDVIKGPIQDLANWIGKIADKFNNASPATKKLIVALGGIAAAIGPALLVGGKLLTGISKFGGKFAQFTKGFKALKGLLSPNIILIGLLVGSLVYLWKTNEDFRNSVISAWENIKAIISRVVDFLTALWDRFGDTIVNVFKGVWSFITNSVKNMVSIISSTIGVVSAILHGDWAGLKEHLGDLFNTLLDIFKGIFKTIWGIIKGVIGAIGKAFIGLVKGIIKGIVNLIKGLVSGVVEGIVSLVKAVASPVVNVIQELYYKFEDVFQAIGQIVRGFVELFKNLLLGPIMLVLDLITLDFEAFKEDSRMIWENLANAVQMILDGFMQYISSIWEIVKATTMNAWNSIKQTISSVIEWLFTLPARALEAMNQLIQAMVQGIKNGITSVVSAVQEVGNSILEKLREIPGKVVDIGKNIMSSLADGIKAGVMAPVNAAKSVGSSIRNFLSGGGGGKGADGIHRTGLSRVPFDGYRAVLHKDEEVLTADDPRNINNAGRQAVRNMDKQPYQTAGASETSSGIVFSPSININIEGNTDVNTVRQIEDAVNAQMSLFFRKLNLQRA